MKRNQEVKRLVLYKKKEYYDCIDCTLSNLFECHGEDYRKVFIYCFGFEYLKKEQILNSIVASTLVPIHEIIHDYTNLQYNIEFIKPEDLEKYILDRRENFGILGINLDAFYLPWNKYYNILHRDHNILVDSYDKEKKTLNVYDIYLKPGMLEFDFNLLKSGYKFSYYLTKKETGSKHSHVVEPRQLKEYLKETPEEREEKIKFFIHDIQNITNFDYDPNVVDATDFIFFFTDFIWCRVKALDYIRLLQEHSEHKNLEMITETIQQSLPLWRRLRNYLTKNLILKENACKTQIVELVPELINLEKSLVGYINNM